MKVLDSISWLIAIPLRLSDKLFDFKAAHVGIKFNCNCALRQTVYLKAIWTSIEEKNISR